jgi:hypothetical protein
MKKLRAVVILALFAAVVSGLEAQAASAAGPSPPGATQTLVATVPMQLDCSRLSASAMQYATSHLYCMSSGANAPNNEVGGNCGYSYLYMYNAHRGDARFHYGFHSTDGTVIDRNLTISWANWTHGVVGNFPDSIGMFNATYRNTVDKYTKSGFVTGVLYGDVFLWWGGICTLNDPTSSAEVTWQ